MRHPTCSPSSFRVVRQAALPCLLVLAALPAAAQMQIYGALDAGIGRLKNSGGQGDTHVFSGGMITSYIGFRGTEDLGGGLKAMFALEQYLRLNTGDSGRFNGDSYFSRTSEVALSGAFGTATLGRQTTFLFQNTASFNPLGGAFGFSPLIRNTFGVGSRFAGDSGWNNAVSYKSPNIAGLSGGIMYAFGETSGGRNVGGHVRYSNGPFAIGLVAQDVQSPYPAGSPASQRSVQLGSSYDLSVVKLFGSLAHIRGQELPQPPRDSTDRVAQLGVSVPLGAGQVLTSWSRASQKESVRPDRTFATVGYVHTLSKRTNVYAMLMHDKLEQQGGATSYGLGLRHSF